MLQRKSIKGPKTLSAGILYSIKAKYLIKIVPQLL